MLLVLRDHPIYEVLGFDAGVLLVRHLVTNATSKKDKAEAKQQGYKPVEYETWAQKPMSAYCADMFEKYNRKNCLETENG
jgi:hypothetical protein